MITLEPTQSLRLTGGIASKRWSPKSPAQLWWKNTTRIWVGWIFLTHCLHCIGSKSDQRSGTTGWCSTFWIWSSWPHGCSTEEIVKVLAWEIMNIWSCIPSNPTLLKPYAKVERAWSARKVAPVPQLLVSMRKRGEKDPLLQFQSLMCAWMPQPTGWLWLKRRGDARYQGAQVHQKPSAGNVMFTSVLHPPATAFWGFTQNRKSEYALSKREALIQTISKKPHKHTFTHT